MMLTEEDCVVAPADPESRQPPAGAAPDTLSDALDPCNGVLVPEGIGDMEILLIPPPVGETPIIEPQDLPAQQPQAE